MGLKQTSNSIFETIGNISDLLTDKVQAITLENKLEYETNLKLAKVDNKVALAKGLNKASSQYASIDLNGADDKRLTLVQYEELLYKELGIGV